MDQTDLIDAGGLGAAKMAAWTMVRMAEQGLDGTELDGIAGYGPLWARYMHDS